MTGLIDCALSRIDGSATEPSASALRAIRSRRESRTRGVTQSLDSVRAAQRLWSAPLDARRKSGAELLRRRPATQLSGLRRPSLRQVARAGSTRFAARSRAQIALR